MSREIPRHRAELLASLPPEPYVDALWEEIKERVARSSRRVMVLDDDPTGVQTVHGVDVLTTWDPDDLSAALRDSRPLFYVLTNSRALGQRAAVDTARQVVENVAQADAGVAVDVISRGDSTLRGHYPWELDPLTHGFGAGGPHGHLIVPAFPEGGRITVDAIHYVEDDGAFVPVGTTDFARDPSFGFSSSFLPDWVEEKSNGRWRAGDVLHVPLVLLRSGDPDRVAALLACARHNQPIVIDAVSYADLIVLVTGLLRAEDRGLRFLARTAASYVKVRGGISDRPFLSHHELVPEEMMGSGLILVGSFVKRTSEQLSRALELPQVSARELVVQPLMQGRSARTIHEFAAWADDELARGQNPLIYTSRELLEHHDTYDHFTVAARVSTVLSSIPSALHHTPAWIVAKGGITSSDVATKGLSVRRAWVLGQIATGIPVWRLGEEARFPGMPYVIFPGNVGGPNALADVINLLSCQYA
ncbi:MAG: four-carbon acid sugar kinase family protein [Chloroflexota bacterium]